MRGLKPVSIIGLALAAALAAGPVAARDSRVPLPSHPEANARFSATQQCVEPIDVMRRDHMEFILHQRDETMHLGIRTTRHSLAECVACHVSKDHTGKPVPVNARGQFCESCHEYAAVEIDCFQCHATVPRESEFEVREAEHKSPAEKGRSASHVSGAGVAR